MFTNLAFSNGGTTLYPPYNPHRWRFNGGPQAPVLHRRISSPSPKPRRAALATGQVPMSPREETQAVKNGQRLWKIKDLMGIIGIL